MKVSFHPKEQSVELYGPASFVGYSLKAEAIEKLLIALVVIAERGQLPIHIRPSLCSHLSIQATEVREKCLGILAQNVALSLS